MSQLNSWRTANTGAEQLSWASGRELRTTMRERTTYLQVDFGLRANPKESGLADDMRTLCELSAFLCGVELGHDIVGGVQVIDACDDTSPTVSYESLSKQ